METKSLLLLKLDRLLLLQEILEFTRLKAAWLQLGAELSVVAPAALAIQDRYGQHSGNSYSWWLSSPPSTTWYRA